MNQRDSKILELLSNHIREHIGIYFPEKKHNELLSKLTELKNEHGFKSLDALIEHLLSQDNSKEIIDILAKKFTIGETYFWRDRGMFRVLEDTLLPQLIETKRKTRKELRIWSAAASTGEEAYSIGILLQRLIPDIHDWNITILATDINQAFLNKAKEGIYTEWSFRSAPHWLKAKCFTSPGKGRYEINRDIKQMVTFGYMNLFKDPYPSLSNDTNAMDLIFCRNVLMYFNLEDIKKISDNLYNCLVEDGILVTTPSESFHYLSPRFKTKHLGEVTIYQRSKYKETEKEFPQRKTSIEIPQFSVRKRVIKSRKTQITKPAKKKMASKAKEPDFNDAKHLYATGEFVKAENILEHIINGQSNNESLMLMARIKANLGKLEEANNFCRLSIQKNKLCPTCYYLQALIEAELGNVQSAYEALKKSFYLDPEFVITNFALGRFARNLGRMDESDKHFRNTIDLLNQMEPDELIPESDGMTAARLREIILETTEF